MLSSRRGYSSLAEKLREAAVGDAKRRGNNGARATVPKEDAVDGEGEAFRELFVMPKRKLAAQMALERITGRSEQFQRYRYDIMDRLAIRQPREKEMSTDQDWPSVWPAARSFASSVVPLPIRMGTRKNPDKRAPFKKEGNLELVKIPNFLHLTPAHIQRHCEKIKQFCTPFPPEFTINPEGAAAAVPLIIKYSDYVHQGTNIRDNRARVITMQIKLASLSLTNVAKEKFMRLAGNKYDEATDVLTITTDRCYTRAQNYDYAHYLLTVLYHESNKVEVWEDMKTREDHLKAQFEGSQCKQRLEELLEKSQASEDESSTKKVQEFGQVWQNYMNKEETAASTREYAAKMKELLGFRLKQKSGEETASP